MSNQKTSRSRRNMPLGQLEQFIMLAITYCGDVAYGPNLRAEIKDRTNIDLTVGNLYGTLERLINKQFVGYTENKTTKPKVKKRFYLTTKGQTQLHESVEMTEKMLSGYEHETDVN